MTATAPTPTTRRRDPLLPGIRLLLGLLGAAKLYGAVYFTFVATAEQGGDPQGVVDWFVVIWSFALAGSLIIAAVLLGNHARGRRIAVLTVGLLLVEIAFSFVKLFAYDEPEALGFMAVDLVLLGLIAVAVRRPN